MKISKVAKVQRKPVDYSFPIRLSQAEHLLAALENLPADMKTTVIHTDLIKRISRVKEAWKKAESKRKQIQTKRK